MKIRFSMAAFISALGAIVPAFADESPHEMFDACQQGFPTVSFPQAGDVMIVGRRQNQAVFTINESSIPVFHSKYKPARERTSGGWVDRDTIAYWDDGTVINQNVLTNEVTTWRPALEDAQLSFSPHRFRYRASPPSFLVEVNDERGDRLIGLIDLKEREFSLDDALLKGVTPGRDTLKFYGPTSSVRPNLRLALRFKSWAENAQTDLETLTAKGWAPVQIDDEAFSPKNYSFMPTEHGGDFHFVNDSGEYTVFDSLRFDGEGSPKSQTVAAKSGYDVLRQYWRTPYYPPPFNVTFLSGEDGAHLANIPISDHAKKAKPRVANWNSAFISLIGGNKDYSVFFVSDVRRHLRSLYLFDQSRDNLVELSRCERPEREIRIERLSHPSTVTDKPIQSYLFEPARDVARGLIVYLHGGPHELVSPVGNNTVSQFLSWDYAVLAINYAGSTGYGKSFRDALYGSVNLAVSDIVGITADVYQSHSARFNENLIGFGESFGAYLLAKANSDSDLPFTRTVLMSGIYDVPELLESANALHDGEAVKAHPRHSEFCDSDSVNPFGFARSNSDLFSRIWRDLTPSDEAVRATSAFYRSMSPVNTATTVNGAVMIIHGCNDIVVPASQAIDYGAALEAEGVGVSYLFSKQGHQLTRQELRRLIGEVKTFLRDDSS